MLHKINAVLMATLKPLGIWGLGGLAFIDAGLFPLPTTMDGVVIGYVAANHSRFLLYVLMASATSAVGSLVPYYVGRAGGELFLLKRINRERYERLRDRFERQEFLAIMLPAMAPPPFPVTLFELAAGVFEMRPPVFFGAMFLGKFIRFTAVSFLIIFYGQRILDSITSTMHDHLGLALAICGVVLLSLAIYVVRKLFDRRKGAKFPVEEDLDLEG